jgi:hypothetical protein
LCGLVLGGAYIFTIVTPIDSFINT